MAEVTFYGVGANGFPDPNSQLVANRQANAEVQLEGLAPTGPVAGLATEVEIFSPTLTARAEFTQVQFFRSEQKNAASENPNDNEILLIVSQTNDALSFRVDIVPADVPQGDGSIVHPSPVADDLRLFAGIHAPSGLCGKDIVFLSPTGGGPLQMRMPIEGATGTIRNVGPTLGVNTLTMMSALPVVPTVGDRLVAISTNRSLRRTPVLEIILE